jgi:hypothetical protein
MHKPRAYGSTSFTERRGKSGTFINATYFRSILELNIENLGYKVNNVTACPVTSASADIFLFSLRSKNFSNKEHPMLIKENTIISIMASAYRGESAGRKKYGLQMLPSWASRFTIAVPAARFSGVWFSVLAAHE